jgi:hypothetical protein
MKRLLIPIFLLPLIDGCSTLPGLIKAAGQSVAGNTNSCTLEIHSLMYGDVRFTWNAIPWSNGGGSVFNNVAGTPVMFLPGNTAVLTTPEGGMLIKQKPK